MNSGCSASNGCGSCTSDGGLERLVPPHVASSVQVDVAAGAPDHEDLLDRAVAGDGGVDRRLQRGGRAAAVAAVGGDDDLGLGVDDAGAQRVGGEPAEDDRVRGAEPGAGEHRDDRLGDHRQVDRDPVALADAERLQGVGGPADLALQLGVGDGAGVAGLALEVDGHPVAVAGLDVPVDAVVRRVELAADEPLGERRVVPVEGAGEVGGPGEVAARPARPRSPRGRRRRRSYRSAVPLACAANSSLGGNLRSSWDRFDRVSFATASSSSASNTYGLTQPAPGPGFKASPRISAGGRAVRANGHTPGTGVGAGRDPGGGSRPAVGRPRSGQRVEWVRRVSGSSGSRRRGRRRCPHRRSCCPPSSPVHRGAAGRAGVVVGLRAQLGDHLGRRPVGWTDFIRASTPATCGEAIEVPLLVP